jgi:type I restriction enzyme S subunit
MTFSASATSTATVPTLTLSTLRRCRYWSRRAPRRRPSATSKGALDDKVALHREIVQVTEELRDSLLPLLLTNR